MSTIEEVPSVVEVSIDEVSRAVFEFSGDSSAQQVDEASGDISIVDEESIGT